MESFWEITAPIPNLTSTRIQIYLEPEILRTVHHCVLVLGLNLFVSGRRLVLTHQTEKNWKQVHQDGLLILLFKRSVWFKYESSFTFVWTGRAFPWHVTAQTPYHWFWTNFFLGISFLPSVVHTFVPLVTNVLMAVIFSNKWLQSR